MSNINVVTSQAGSVLNTAQTKASIERTEKAAKIASTLSDKDLNKINKTAQDFEAVFVTEMMRPMMNMVDVDPEFGGGKGEEVFRDFTLNEYGKRFASQGGLGIATHVKEQLIRMQEQASNPDANPETIAAAVKDAMAKSAPGKMVALH